MLETTTAARDESSAGDANTEFNFVNRPLRIPPPAPAAKPPKPKPAPKEDDAEKQRKKEERRRQREKSKQQKPVVRTTRPAFQLLQTVIESESRRAYVADSSGTVQAVTESEALDQLTPTGGRIKEIASGKIVVEFQGRDFAFSTSDGATR